MITRNKVLLITKSTAVAKFVRSFEAVEEINDISQTSRVWETTRLRLFSELPMLIALQSTFPKKVLWMTKHLSNSAMKMGLNVVR